MPKLTEAMCAIRRPIKKYAPPTYVGKPPAFRQMKAPAALRNRLTGREDTMKPSRVCQQELAIMLQCLKSHDFNQVSCSHEITAFNSCYDDFKNLRAMKEQMKQRDVMGLSVKSMTSHQKNQVLKRFPQATETFKENS